MAPHLHEVPLLGERRRRLRGREHVLVDDVPLVLEVPQPRRVAHLGSYPIVTLEKQVLNMIGNLA